MKFNLKKIDIEKLKELVRKLFLDRHEKELQELLQMEARAPEDMRLKQRVADAFYRLGKLDEAVDTFKIIAARFESDEFILKAIDTYKNILKIKPGLVETNLRLSTLYLRVNMVTEAANQLRIAIAHYARTGDVDRTLALAQQLVKIDPSNENRSKLAEIYQGCGMPDEAVKQYEFLAKDARLHKNYDKLLHFYELILPHRQGNIAIIKDICILYLRKKQPERAISILEGAKLGQDPNFAELSQKAKLMMEALKRQKK